jgi:hypothetical protein
MDLFRKLRTLLGALTQRPPTRPSPRSRVEAKDQAEKAVASTGKPARQERADEASEGERVADLIEQQKAALERSEGQGGANPPRPADH